MTNKNIFNQTNFSDYTFNKVCKELASDIGEAIVKGVDVRNKIDYWFECKYPSFSEAERKCVADTVYAGIGLVAIALLK